MFSCSNRIECAQNPQFFMVNAVNARSFESERTILYRSNISNDQTCSSSFLETILKIAISESFLPPVPRCHGRRRSRHGSAYGSPCALPWPRYRRPPFGAPRCRPWEGMTHRVAVKYLLMEHQGVIYIYTYIYIYMYI